MFLKLPIIGVTAFSDYQSTIVRGINGSNGHPKFRFIEEMVYEGEEYDSQGRQIASEGSINYDQYKVHDEENDYIKGFVKSVQSFFKDGAEVDQFYAKRVIPGPFEVYTNDEFGWNNSTNYASLSVTDKEKARKIGRFKEVVPILIPTDSTDLSLYKAAFHSNLLGKPKSSYDIIGAGKEDLASVSSPSRMMRVKKKDEFGVDVIIDGAQQYEFVVDPRKFPLYIYRNSGRRMYYDPEDAKQFEFAPTSDDYPNALDSRAIRILVRRQKTTTGISSLNDWDVLSGDVDVLDNYIPGVLDGRVIDLSGYNNGTLRSKQTIALAPGNYEVSFEQISNNGVDEESFSIEVGSLLNKSFGSVSFLINSLVTIVR